MKIQYYTKHIYGIPKEYIVDTNIAFTVAKLTGQKTITLVTKDTLSELGFTFEEVLPPKS